MENNTHNNDLSGKLYHHTVSPSDAVWNRIQAQLDADLAAFDTGNRQRFWWYAGSLVAVASIVFLTWNHYDSLRMQAYEPVAGLSGGVTQKSTYLTDNKDLIADQVIDQLNIEETAVLPGGILQTASVSQTTSRTSAAANTERITDVSAEEMVTENLPDAVASEETEMTTIDDQTSEEPAEVAEHDALAVDPAQEDAQAEEEAAKQEELAQLIAADETDEAEIEPVESVKKPAHSPFEGFYLGASGGWHASTMLTGEEVVINDNPIQTGVRFGPSKGLTLGYVFGPNLSLQAEYLYNVVEGQNYYMEVEGSVRSKTMSLYFDQIPVTVKLRTPRTIHAYKMPASLNIVAGTQLNILKDYQVPRENKLDLEGDIYRKTSFSLLAGAEYEVLVTDHIMLSLGLEGSLSENVSTSNDPVGSFPKHSVSGGAKGGVYYLFGR